MYLNYFQGSVIGEAKGKTYLSQSGTGGNEIFLLPSKTQKYIRRYLSSGYELVCLLNEKKMCEDGEIKLNAPFFPNAAGAPWKAGSAM